MFHVPKDSLAVSVAYLHFGEVMKKVVTQLILGPASVDEIVKETQLSRSQIRDSLVIGNKHNFIYFDEESSTGQFRVSSFNLVSRLRFPKYNSLAKEKFQDVGDDLVGHILRSGRDTGTNLHHICQENIRFTEVFAKLAQTKLVIPCTKFIKDDYFLTDQEKAPSEPLNTKKRNEDADTTPMKTVASSNTTKENKTYHSPSNEQYWCINPQMWDWELLKKEILCMSLDIFDQDCVKLIKSVFEAIEVSSESFPGPLVIDHSVYLEQIKQEFELRDGSTTRFAQLIQLLCEKKWLKENKTDSQSKIVLGVQHILSLLQSRQVCNILKYKLNHSSSVIFNLLLNGFLDEKQIQFQCSIPIGAVRESLQTLFNLNIISFQTLRLPNSSISLWSASITSTAKMLATQFREEIEHLVTKCKLTDEEHKVLIEKYQEQERLRRVGNRRQLLTKEELQMYNTIMAAQHRTQNAISCLISQLLMLQSPFFN